MPIDKGFHWSVDAYDGRRADERENRPYNGAILAQVVSPVNGLGGDERVRVDSFLGQKVINYAYAFASPNAWIRGQPEARTTVISVIGGDTKDLQPIGYFDSGKAAQSMRYRQTADAVRVSPTSTIPKLQPYRTLTPGDIDLGSGFAQTFLGLRDVHQSRGGLSHFTMTSTRARVETPLLEVQGPAHVVSPTLNDEQRFGTVRRTVSGGKASAPSLIRGPGLSTRGTFTAPFAKEMSVSLDWFGTPNKLLDHRQGIVVEDDGSLGKATKTSRNLRARLRWFTPVFGDSTRAEVDEAGNWYLGSALAAEQGGVVEVPVGSFSLDVGQRMQLRAKQDVDISSDFGRLTGNALAGFRFATPASGEIDGRSGLTLSSFGTVRVTSPGMHGIELGSALGVVPKWPVLVGNPLYLNTLQGVQSADMALYSLIASYGTAAGQAWSLIGSIATLLDPTGSVSSACLSAGAAAAAMTGGATASGTALSLHMPTLASNPAGFLSVKTVSE